PQLVGDDVAQRGLAQAGWAEDQDVVQGLAAVSGGLDVQAHLLAHRLLAEVLVQPLRADAGLDGLVLAGGAGGDDALLVHRAMVAWRHRGRMARRRSYTAGGRVAGSTGSASTPCGTPAMSGMRCAPPSWQSMQVASPVARKVRWMRAARLAWRVRSIES